MRIHKCYRVRYVTDKIGSVLTRSDSFPPILNLKPSHPNGNNEFQEYFLSL